MFAALVRAMCGALVLLGLAAGDGSLSSAAPGDLPHAGFRAPAALVAEPADVPPPAGQHRDTIRRIYRVTAYCDRGLTAGGVESGVGQCAAPADIPFGARIRIPALDRTFVVTDRTAKRFRHNTVDLFMPDRQTCLQFGCRYLECEVALPKQPFRYGSRRLRAAVAAAHR